EFLSLIADSSFMDAAQLLRSAGERLGDPRTLFWYDGTGAAARMNLAAELIMPPVVVDDFGQEAEPSSTYLRYQVELAYVPPQPDAPVQIGSIRLLREDLNYITQTEARTRIAWPHSASGFRNIVVQNRRKGTGYISTAPDTSPPTF